MATKLLKGVTTNTSGTPVRPFAKSDNKAGYVGNMTFQAKIVGTGAVSVTVTIEGSNGCGWTVLKTLSLTGTTTDTKADTIQGQPWDQIRATTASISGTGATVDCALNC